MENSKGSTLTMVLVAILIALVFGAGGYLLGSKNKATDESAATTPSTSTTAPTSTKKSTDTTTADTASWKIFTSEKYGFSIKYPADWIAKEAASSETKATDPVVRLSSPETAEKSAKTPTTPSNEGGLSPYDLDILYAGSIADISNDSSITTLDQLIKQPTTYFEPKQITFAGEKAYEAQSMGMVSPYTIVVEKNNHIYQLKTYNVEKKADLPATLKSVIDSFQFTK